MAVIRVTTTGARPQSLNPLGVEDPISTGANPVATSCLIEQPFSTKANPPMVEDRPRADTGGA